MVKINLPFSNRLLSATLLLSVLATSCGGQPPQMGGMPPTPVQLQEVKASTVQQASEFVGALEAENRVDLRPETDGRVVEILVTPGQSVRTGAPIAKLRTDRNAAQVTGARADVGEAAAARNTANAQLKAAQAEAEQAKADVVLQNAQYQRTATLVAEGAQAQQALDQATNQRNTAIAAFNAAQQRIGVAQSSLEEANARLASAQADQQVAAVDLDDNLVTAPIDGIVGSIAAKVGDLLTTSTIITSIIQNSSLELNLSVPIERSPQLRAGLPVELLDQEGKALTRGRISFISPQVNATEQAVLAKATFPNDGRLRDGQFVRARVIWETSPGILIPTGAVTRIAGQTFVYVAAAGEAKSGTGEAQAEPSPGQSPSGEPQQVAQQRLVKLGNIQGNSYQVLEGLKSGEQVIVTGILNLQDGSPITVAQATGSPPVSAQ